MVSGSEGVQGRAVARMQIEDAGVCASYVKRCVHGCVSHRFAILVAVSRGRGYPGLYSSIPKLRSTWLWVAVGASPTPRRVWDVLVVHPGGR